MQRTNTLEKTVMLGKTKERRRGQKRMRLLDDITDSVDMSLSKTPKDSKAQRRLNTEELMLSSCGVGEDSGEFLGLQGDQTSQP